MNEPMKHEEIERMIKDHVKWYDGKGGRQADFRGRFIHGFNFEDTDLRDIIFKGAEISNSSFTSVNLSDSNFVDATVFDSTFDSCEFFGTDFTGSTLRNNGFYGCDFSCSVLEKVDLCGSIFKDSKLSGILSASNAVADALTAVFAAEMALLKTANQ